MPTLPHLKATYREALYGQLGSFWTSVFADQKHLRKLLALTTQSRMPSDLQSMAADLAGDNETARKVSQVVVSFRPKSVIRTSEQLYDDPDNPVVYGEGLNVNEDDQVYNFFRLRYYVLTLDKIVPLSIQSVVRPLVLGVDFFILQEKYIFFRDDPAVLFPDGRYLVTEGYRTDYYSFLSYLVRTKVATNADYVVRYYRHSQTPKDFKLAMAAVAGLQILRQSQRLTSRLTNLGTTVYVFEQTVLRVDYPHTPLVVDQVYPQDYIVGDGIQVFQARDGGQAWWRQLDWRGGLSLDPILDFKGLSLVDRITVAYGAGQDAGSTNGSKVHARVKLSDDFFAEEPYWQTTSSRETRLGAYLNSVLGLTEDVGSDDPSVLDTFEKLRTAIDEANAVNPLLVIPVEDPDLEALPNSKLVNALDVFFEAILGESAYVVLIDSNQIKNPHELYKFLSRDMLVGGTPVVFVYGPDFAIESLQITDTISLAGDMTHYPVSPLAFDSPLVLVESYSGEVSLKAEPYIVV